MHKVAPLSIWSDAMCGYAWNYGIRNARIFVSSVHLTVLWWHALCIIKTLKGIGKEPSNIYKDKRNRISKCYLTIFFSALVIRAERKTLKKEPTESTKTPRQNIRQGEKNGRCLKLIALILQFTMVCMYPF